MRTDCPELHLRVFFVLVSVLCDPNHPEVLEHENTTDAKGIQRIGLEVIFPFYICRLGRVFTYLVLAVFLMNSVSLNQLPKIPLLIIHYLEHQDSKTSLGFFQFLDMHYVGNDGNDNDNDRDMQLPYKKIDFSCLQGFTLPQLKAVLNTPSIAYKRQSSPPLLTRFWADPALTSLFRPPKVEA